MRRVLPLSLLLVAVIACPAGAAAPASCGAPKATKVITGRFLSNQTGSFVMLPFDVPKGTTAIRGWYCYDQPDGPTAQLPAYAIRHTLDFGYYAPRPAGQKMWTTNEYRGWSGSGFFKDITVSPEGYAANPDPSKKPVGTTSRGYRPGPIKPGTWAVELGVAAVVPQLLGDSDGGIDWRVELQLETNPEYADHPYVPAKYDTRPAKAAAGWYAGDFHVHTDQSGDAKQNAPAKAVFDYAFKPRSAGGAGLDFIQATDHNTDAGWGEWGRYQGSYPGKLIARNEEITTYRGHINAPWIKHLADYRTGPVFERKADGKLEQLRAARPVHDIFKAVHADGGVVTINHPTIFDARIPPLGIICRGCSWEYDDAETDYPEVDAIEVETGPQGLKLATMPGPSPFTPLAVDFYEQALKKAGHSIAAVSGSDSHSGGNSPPDDITGTPVGSPATMVYAPELSERGIADGVRAGHTYVRSFGLASPELRFNATSAGQPVAMMGDTVHATSASFTARVIGPGAGPEPLLMVISKNGLPYALSLVTGNDFSYSFSATAPASGIDHYGLEILRGSALESYATPIFLTREPAPVITPLSASGLGASRVSVRGGRLTLRCRAAGEDLNGCRVRLRRHEAGDRSRTIGSGKVAMSAAGTRSVPIRLTSAGARLLRRRGTLGVTAETTATDVTGHTSTQRRRVTLVRR